MILIAWQGDQKSILYLYIHSNTTATEQKKKLITRPSDRKKSESKIYVETKWNLSSVSKTKMFSFSPSINNVNPWKEKKSLFA